MLSLIVFVLPATLIFLAAIVFHDIPAFIMTTAGALETIFNVLWLPLYAIAYVIFYFDLRVRNQGYDLSQRIDQIESETDWRFRKEHITTFCNQMISMLACMIQLTSLPPKYQSHAIGNMKINKHY